MVACGLAAVSASADVVRLSEPVLETESFETFGSPLPEQSEAVSLGTLLDNGSQYLDQAVVVRTRVCQAQGR